MDKNYEYKKEIKNVRWLLFGVMLALFASEVLFQAWMSFMSSPPNNYVRMAIVECLAFIIPLSVYGKIVVRKANTKKDLMLNRISTLKVVYAILLGVTGQFVIMLVNLPTEYIHQTFFEKGGATVPEAMGPGMFVLAIVSVGIIPAFLEELLMRGMVFQAYNKVSTKVAAIFTTFVFVVFHGKPECILGYIFMGYMATFIMRRTNSLYAAMIYHFSSNVTAIIFGMIALRIISFVWVLLAIMTVLFVIFVICFYVAYTPPKRIRSKNEGKLFLSSVLSLPILLSLGIVLIKYWLLNLR